MAVPNTKQARRKAIKQLQIHLITGVITLILVIISMLAKKPKQAEQPSKIQNPIEIQKSK